MKVYVEAQSKAALIRRLAAGEEISGYNYSMFGGGGQYMLDDTLEDGTIIAIYSQMSQGNPVAKSWGTWTNGVLKAESFAAESAPYNFQYSGGATGKCTLCAKQVVPGTHTKYVPNNYPICGDCYWARFDNNSYCCDEWGHPEIYPCLKCGTYEQSPYDPGCNCLDYSQLTDDEWDEMADKSIIECSMCGMDLSMKDHGAESFDAEYSRGYSYERPLFMKVLGVGVVVALGLGLMGMGTPVANE